MITWCNLAVWNLQATGDPPPDRVHLHGGLENINFFQSRLVVLNNFDKFFALIKESHQRVVHVVFETHICKDRSLGLEVNPSCIEFTQFAYLRQI